MVRQFIRRFLRWLRALLSQIRGSKGRPQDSLILKRLPSARQNLLPSPHGSPAPAVNPFVSDHGAAAHAHAPAQLHTPVATVKTAAEAEESERPTPPLNPDSNRLSNSSNFEVLLSDYTYSPSPAVQELKQQLFRPDSTAAIPKARWTSEKTIAAPYNLLGQSDPKSPAEFPIESPTESQPNPGRQPERGATLYPVPEINNQLQQAPQPQKNTLEQTGNLENTETLKQSLENNSKFLERMSDKGNEPSSLPPPSSDLFPSPWEDQLVVTGSLQPLKTPLVDSTSPQSITKQGIVKLLFKLKKSNSHGYIAPHDGSKDILFHQKYINDEVFCQLALGVEVEVTAHITEGKAYADHIRIL
ncbi:cold shock domain-containing protein [Leptothoe sp. PORK10 BA2]|uniref:cold shock domain-containing protein n=1 Tax=Leptothoe sp. PORK10 BA2 TaxID=3110254 RepID=UPI002B1EAD09|nr:cold shock domain-containing protein [Leptothoe sp. PORK10 BA2]MEA5464476.1 cold shock domain-containing protein [Leptothoe sp. PORK10 BA2]